MAGADAEDTAEGTVAWLYRLPVAAPAALHTIAEVSAASGLPGPVIMQLVERTWTAAGWMYTGEQLDAAVALAAELRCGRTL